ncbi:MAG: TatD family hydrolase [Bacteroidales bacterium]|nr:TatD family hydrolase [Bacteroidales bacterium]
MKAINIHTHQVDFQSDDYQVLSIEALDFLSSGEASQITLRTQPLLSFEAFAARFPSNVYFSIGIHPWKAASPEAQQLLDESGAFTHTAVESFRSLLQHPRVVLMGEIGLDKLCDAPFDKQLLLLEQQLLLAADLRKPLILHVVKAMDEVLALHRRFSSQIPAWIIHGFRGNAQQAQQYLRHGFHLSFGPHHHPAALQSTPPSRRFFETD